METIIKCDFLILDFIQNVMKCSFLDSLMVFFTKIGDNGIIWIIIALIMLISEKYRKVGAALTITLTICLVLGNEVLKELFMRQRPFQIKEFQLLIPAPVGYSFPSGHTMSSFAAATTLYLTKRKFGKWAFVVAFFIAFSRMYLYVHFLTDVLAGALSGILFGYLGTAIIYRKLKFKRHGI